MDSELKIAAGGIAAIFLLQTLALIKGVDGVVFGLSMAGLGGIIGWVFKNYHNKRK